MNSLFRKFKHNTLASEDVRKLRDEIAAMTDEQIDELLSASADEDIVLPADDAALARIKERIDVRNGMRHRGVRIYKAVSVAAAVIVPLLVIAGVYFYSGSAEYNRYKDMLAKEIVFSTRDGERAGVCLPDGTRVMLESQSRLAYTMKHFSDTERRVSMDGQGHFEVVRNPANPFVINANNLEILVTGTVFDLASRNDDNMVRVYLEEGEVHLQSLISQSSVTLDPHMLAEYNGLTGEITVREVTGDRNNIAAVMRGDIVVENERLEDVLAMLGRHYDRKVVLNADVYAGDRFTGCLSGNDMDDALDVICKSYHLTVKHTDDSILLVP